MERIITHPNNVELLLKQFASAGKRGPLDFFFGIPIVADRNIPERDIEKRWRPPAGDRFCEYGPEDEAWMRPLGLGWFEYVDKGPLFYRMLMPIFSFKYLQPLTIEPRSIIKNYA